MKIELKKIEYSERLSQETNAFAADLYIDGKKAGMTSNEGHGGPTNYYATTDSERQLIRDAEAFCKGLPDIQYPARYGLEAFTVPMDLEHYIDQLLEDHLQQKAVLKFNNKLERHMKDHILYGIPDQSCTMQRLKFPVDILLALPNGDAIMRDIIVQNILPELKDGIVLLNKNIPIRVLEQAGLNKDQYVTPKAVSQVKKQSKIKKGKGL